MFLQLQNVSLEEKQRMLNVTLQYTLELERGASGTVLEVCPRNRGFSVDSRLFGPVNSVRVIIL